MNTNHTPGPWKAVNAGQHWNNPSLINWEIHWSDDGECVADTVYEEADAYLVAAAPELLEALKAMQRWAVQISGKVILPDVPAFDGLIDQVAAALAKAEGR